MVPSPKSSARHTLHGDIGSIVNTRAYITKLFIFRFQCECEDCGLVGAESRANDVMRARIVRCRQEWSTTQVRLAASS